MKKSRVILIGIIIIVSISFLVIGLNFLKGNNYFVSENNYYVTYHNIEGLSASNPVLVNGFKVGQVKSISLLTEQNSFLLVELTITQNLVFNDSTIARITSLDLMGSKGVNLIIGNGKNILSPGDTLISQIEDDLKDQVSAQMLPLKLKAEDLMVSIEDAVKVIKNLFNKTNTDNIEGTLRHLNKTFATLEHTSTELDSLLTNGRGKLDSIFNHVESITSNLKNNNEQISLILNNLGMITDSIAKSDLISVINNANRTLAQTDSIMSKINNGEGTIGQLINNDTLYQNLEKASISLDKLMIDIRENPKRYIHYSLFDFGKTIVVDEEGLKKEKSKKKKKNKDSADLSYRIQIKSAKERISFDSKELKSFKNIEEHYINGLYKYTTASGSSFSEMKKIRKDLLDIFPDAFITQYKQDSIISRSY